jgi:heat shock protein HslJ
MLAMDDPTRPEGSENEVTEKAGPPGKPGFLVYVAVALLACLVLMVVFINVPGTRASAGAAMTRTDWQLEFSADKNGVMVPALSGPAITASFSRNGRVSGFSGCNHYTATYTTKDYSIAISPVATSLIFCTDPGIMDQEQVYLSDLEKSVELWITESEL